MPRTSIRRARARSARPTIRDGGAEDCPWRTTGFMWRSGSHARHQLGVPNKMLRSMFGGDGQRAAGAFEVWAARAWNVFNEGRPFSVVYPLMVLLCAALVGPGARRFAAARAGGHARARAGALALHVPAARPGAALARRARLDPAARALARAAAARGRARRLRVLHGRALGLDLLPPAHGRAVEQRPPLLAARAHQLGSHERQRARAAAQAR